MSNKLSGTFKEIASITIPLLFGNLSHTAIALSDIIIMGHHNTKQDTDLAAIGYVSLFFLILVIAGGSFTKGAQILIAKHNGRESYEKVGQITDHTLVLLTTLGIFLATLLFFFFKPFFFFLVQDPDLTRQGNLFMQYRAPGIVINLIAQTFVAYFAGTHRTKILGLALSIMAGANIFLNLILVYGKWGFPEMGIAGSGLASTLAEAISVLVLFAGVAMDKQRQRFQYLKFKNFGPVLMKEILVIGLPIVGQALIGFTSWIAFFTFIARMGQTPLATSNLLKAMYQLISIPAWSLANAANTLIGNLHGQRKIEEIIPVMKRITLLSFLSSLIFIIPVAIFPHKVMSLLSGRPDMATDAIGPLYILLVAMLLFSVAIIPFNVIVSLGNTIVSLGIEILSITFYLIYSCYIFIICEPTLTLAWLSELLYWVFIGGLSLLYLYKSNWKQKLDQTISADIND